MKQERGLHIEAYSIFEMLMHCQDRILGFVNTARLMAYGMSCAMLDYGK